MLPRLFVLENKEIPSSECDGYLHKSTKTQNQNCIECDKPITKGQEYVIYAHYLDSYLWHKDCWLLPRDNPSILGISIKKIMRYGCKRTLVVCKSFPDKTSKGEAKVYCTPKISQISLEGGRP